MLLNVLGCQLTYKGQAEANAEAWFSIALRPRKPEGSLGRTAQDGHLDSHTVNYMIRCFVELILTTCYCRDTGKEDAAGPAHKF